MDLLRSVDGITELVLADGAAGAALDLTACERLEELTATLGAVSDLRALLIRSEGSAFCVGGDVREMAAADDRGAHIAAMAGALHRAILNLRALEAPIVVAVQGAVAGAGLGLVAAGDLVFASPAARFAWAYTKIGLSADAGATWWLPRCIGLRRTQEMALLGRTLDAAEAAGLVTTVVEGDALQTTARAAAERLALGPAGAYAAVKRLLESGRTNSLADQLNEEARSISSLAAGPEASAGLTAFLEKRAPIFR